MRSKARLTITLSPDLLGQLDRMIDRRTIRSRSHAIEVLLRQSLSPTVETAVLLAGGTDRGVESPAMVPIGGRPLISTTVDHLMKAGVRNFVVLAGREETGIRDLMGDGGDIGATIRYVREERPLGTAGALKGAEPYVGQGPFLVIHADVLTNIDIESFTHFHMSENTLATIAVKPRQAELEYGRVVLQGNRIIQFLDQGLDQGFSIINTGVYLLRPEVFSMIEDGKVSQLETDVFPLLAGMGELGAYFFQGIWFDVSTPENYRLAEARWRQIGGRNGGHSHERRD